MNELWQPTFAEWSENAVTLHVEHLQTCNASRGEYGVAFIGSRADTQGGAALFWIDEESLYLRLDWANWYPICTDDAANCRELTRRKTALLYFQGDSGLVVEGIKVHHLDALPDDLFVEELPAAAKENQTEEDCETKAKISLLVDQLSDLTDAHLHILGATLFLHGFYKGERVDFYELGGRLLIVTFFPYEDEFLADDEDEIEPIAYWLSNSDMKYSPAVTAKLLRELLKKVIPSDIPTESLIVLGDETRIMNEGEYFTKFFDPTISFAYTNNVEDSLIHTPVEALDDVKGEPRRDILQLQEALERRLAELSADS